jgi:hypothetical protein
MARIQIWMEGFAVTGNQGKAQCIATVEAESFTDALRKQQAKGNLNIKFADDGTPSIWACKLFDNETDAKKTFG